MRDCISMTSGPRALVSELLPRAGAAVAYARRAPLVKPLIVILIVLVAVLCVFRARCRRAPSGKGTREAAALIALGAVVTAVFASFAGN